VVISVLVSAWVLVLSLVLILLPVSSASASWPNLLGLRIGTLDPFVLDDPLLGSTATDREIGLLIYRHLVGWDGQEPVEDLATWESSEDGLEWTLVLGNHEWHDGQPVTARDVIHTLEIIRSDRLEPYFSLLPTLSSVESPDSQTVVLRMDEEPPWPPGLGIPIVPYHLQGEGDLMGSGPFSISDWSPGDYVYLEVASERPALEYVAFIHFESPEIMLEALEEGEIHLATGVPREMSGEIPEGAQVVGGEERYPWIPEASLQAFTTKDLRGFVAHPEGVIFNGTLDTYFNLGRANGGDAEPVTGAVDDPQAGDSIRWVILAAVAVLLLVFAKRIGFRRKGESE